MTELTERETGGMVIPANADVMSIGYDDILDTGEFYAVPGFGLVDDKMLLVGVPHIIIGVTFQIPTLARPRGYVSLRGIVGNILKIEEAKQRKWIPGELAFNPEERIIYNDGSTGVRRQVAELLDRWGLIEVGNEEFTGNDLCPSRFDLPWTEWRSFSQSALQGENTVPEFSTNHNGNLFALNVVRGLRVSEYSNDKADDARTFYL